MFLCSAVVTLMSDDELSHNILFLFTRAFFCRATEVMGQMLQANDTLMQLNFGKNNLNRKCGAAFLGGAGYFDQGLKFNSNLLTLNIAFSGVCRTLEGVQNLANVLSRDNCALEVLDISSCGLTGEHMRVFNAGLNLSRIHLLVLDGNPIQSCGDGYSTLMDKSGRRKRYIRDFKGKFLLVDSITAMIYSCYAHRYAN